MAKEWLEIANLIYFLRFRVVRRLGCVTNTFAGTFARLARFARSLPTPVAYTFLTPVLLRCAVNALLYVMAFTRIASI
jgi:hypothetical protein